MNSQQQTYQLIRDSVLNWSGVLVSGLVTLLLVPILLRELGKEAYGLWIAATASVGMLMSFDLGLEWTILRRVATDPADSDLPQFIGSAGDLYLLVGLAGAALIAFFGVPFSNSLQLSAPNLKLATKLFVIAGAIYFTNQPLKFSNAVLLGLRRFDASNWLISGGSILRAAGMIVSLHLGMGLIGMACWYVIANVILSLVALTAIARFNPRCRFYPGRFRLDALRSSVHFGLASQANALLTRVLWESGPLFIGILRGSAAIVPYHIGQRFPFAVSVIHDRTGNVIFPAAGKHHESEEGTKELLIVGTRWIVLVALPLCMVLWLSAPALLQAWIGVAETETIWIFRLTTGAVFFDAFGAASLHLLWGRGQASTLTRILAAMTIAHVCIGVFLLGQIGIVGVALGFLIPMAAGSLVIMYHACRISKVAPTFLLGSTFSGLLLPVFLVGLTEYVFLTYIRHANLFSLAASGFASCILYLLAFYFLGCKEEERNRIREIFRSVV